jgi:hypothetical protein
MSSRKFEMDNEIQELKQKISGYILRNSKGEYIEIDDEIAKAMLKNKKKMIYFKE